MKISWLEFIGILLMLILIIPTINGVFTILPIELYGYVRPDTHKSLLESLENISYECIALFFLLLYIVKYKPLKALVLPAIDFQCLKSFRTYIYVLLYYAIGLFIDLVILDKFFPDSVQEQVDALDFATLEQYKFLLILAVGLLAPIKEELICRGILLRFFEEKFTFWPAAIISSLLFGIAHTYSVGVMVSAFVTGLFASLLYKQTNSIIPAILLHIMINTCSFLY
ncbi:CPBP family intramembrane metalloprotease [Bacillus cytotoxicus]|uniref:CPBP family intramembrane metalloprotease n=1 Tax=Bacillus cytotoxicus TaxID=580165 RepID=A0ACC6A0L4_9BACI|nr:CPBP family intramembrane metalloprotease [Bacillus cytotoxicus]